MRQLDEGVYWLEGLRSSNAYLLVSDRSLDLIDAGMSGDVPRIADQIEPLGRAVSDLKRIVVTHAHGDHTGGVAELVRRSGARVLAHREEVPYIEGRANLPAGTLLKRAIRWLDDRISGRVERVRVSGVLDADDRLDMLGGLRVIHTPGHTPGSISLYQEESGLLFCGDILFNGNLFTGRGGLREAPRFFAADPDEATETLHGLGSLSVRVLCVGHGEPIVVRTGTRLDELIGVTDA